MHGWKWESICRPKNEGGLGIRRVADINKASGIRLVWRLCTSLWAKRMQENYMHHMYLSQVSATILNSGTWIWICSVKDQALSCMTKNIGNRQDSSLLYDSWLPEGRIADLLLQVEVPPHVSHWMVSDIVEAGEWLLRDACLQGVLWLNLQQTLPVSDISDTWCGNSSCEKFTFSAAWDKVREISPHLQYSSMIWNPHHGPKMAVC